ncbi:MAG TPA: sigma-54 dependent transcriptional regulator [Gammaproteobacteria bacterium]|nr:sigma-54 dependent transcriptional regulator [Gammaproteobacteria bacterium]
MEEEIQAFLIEDDAAVRRAAAQAIALAGLQVKSFGAAEPALAQLTDSFSGVVVSDIKLPGRDGLMLLSDVVAIDREIPVILITGHGDITMAVQAMRDGAYDFMEKPFSGDRLVDIVRRGLEKRRLVLENRRLKEQLAHGIEVTLIGNTSAIQRVRRLVAALAPTDVDVLVHGETGTGKEVVARAIHVTSGRCGPFVAINCGAVPESVFESEVFGHEPGAFTGAVKRRVGKLEYAQGGTLFLDEIESMPLALQVKLLRVLQERVVERLGGNEQIPVTCRVIAATKADLKHLSEGGRFRSDLYYRLNVATIDIPPLRERKEDIPMLMVHFLRVAAERYHCVAPEWTSENLDQWLAYDWPGNVRELKNVADRFCLGLQTAPEGTVSPKTDITPLAERVEKVERSIIEEALRRAGGQVGHAAENLRIPRKTLYDKLNRFGLDPDKYRTTSSDRK